MAAPLEPTLVGLVDDAAIFPPGDADLHDATAAYVARSAEDGAELVASFVLRDTDLPLVRRVPMPLSVVVTGGAGQVAGPAHLARRTGLDLAGLEIAVRDLDDLAGNVRRIVASTAELEVECPVYVELPPTPAEHQWLAAADEAAAAGLRLKFRTGGLDAAAFPSAAVLAGWIDAALDRETAFKCTAGLHRAVRHTGDDGCEHHGFLNVLVATARAFDGAPREEVVAILEDRGLTATHDDVDRGRRWFTSFGSCSVSEPWADLRATGLVR